MVRCWPFRRRILSIVVTGLIFGIVILTFLQVRLEDESEGFNESPAEHESLDFEEDLDNVPHYQHETDLILVEDMEDFAVQHVGSLPELKSLQSSLMRPAKASGCGHFPDLYHLEFNNLHWQVQVVSNLTFYLYKAYYDHRVTGKWPGESAGVRVLTLVDEPIALEGDLHCQFWYSDNPTPKTVRVALKLPIWYKGWSKKGKYTPYILTCYIPKGFIEGVPDPISVSVVQNSCDQATNNLRIENRKDSSNDGNGKKGRFGVCVKGLDFLHNDQSLRLIEWIELLHILGAEKVFFYELAVHPNVKRVLQYYKKEGLVDVTPITLPGNLPNEPNLRHLFLSHKDHSSDKRKNEVIPYNDCLYKNLDKYDFLAVLDTDEVIMPKQGHNWNDLMEQVQSTTAVSGTPASSYCFRNIYFFDSFPENGEEDGDAVPSHLHMLKHVYRAANYTPPKKFIKCFHSTERTTLLHNHFPLGCLQGSCSIQHVDTEIAQLQHYRSTCVKDLKNCDEYDKALVKDRAIWRFKDALISRTTHVARTLHLI